jgi:uncharacterized protein YggE
MTVTGEGDILVEPNIAQIQLEVMTENMQLNQAQQENADRINQVILALVQLGIPKENIQTVAYNINPMYDFIDGEQVFRGYQVSNIIHVKIIGIDQTGLVIDTAVENGVNRVSNIQFTIENEQVYYRRALSAALKDAFDKAETIARTMQLNLNPIPIKIVENMNEPPSTFRALTVQEKSFATPIEPGQIVITASVETQFQY